MLYIGIDISKYKHDCTVIDDAGVIVRNVFSFNNDRAGFNQFLDMYHSLDPTEIKKIGFEATGHYQDNFKVFLEQSGLSFVEFLCRNRSKRLYKEVLSLLWNQSRHSMRK
mgnify:CR=1 FL=1